MCVENLIDFPRWDEMEKGNSGRISNLWERNVGERENKKREWMPYQHPTGDIKRKVFIVKDEIDNFC